MSEEVIERVARALAEASDWGLDWSAMEYDGTADYECRDYWRKLARAAVKEIEGKRLSAPLPEPGPPIHEQILGLRLF